MAVISYGGQTLAQIRAKTRTSVHGRQLGLGDDYLGGVKDLRKVVTHVTTAGTVLPNHGIVILNSTLGSVAATLPAPVTGVGLEIVNVNVESTGGWIITRVSGCQIDSSAGLADTKLTFVGLGGSVRLIGLNSTTWMVLPGLTTKLRVVAS